jgi:lipoprotein-anchoring transpeptidase ErfK/SrfK
MSRHRSEPPPRYQARYGRVVVLVVSLLTTAIAVLGGTGLLPSAADGDDLGGDALVSAERRTTAPGDVDEIARNARPRTPVATKSASPDVPADLADRADSAPDVDEEALPARSGTGRRVVFSEQRQRVWLVSGSGTVQRSYLVSGSVTDNLHPGTYEVYSRSENAVGIDDSGTMRWFVRFTKGPSGAAIGFHTIPVDDGRVVQRRSDLGTPQSHGCIRQANVDAKALWSFAPLGTTVVVV